MEQLMNERKGNPLGYKPVGKLLMQFAIPAIVSMLVNSIYNIVDQIFIGWGVGYQGNAATTVAFPIVTIILSVSTLLGAGGSAFAAIKLGEKKEKEAQKTLCNVFVLLVGVGIVFTILGLLFLEPMLMLFGAKDGAIMTYAKDYSSILLIGTVFNMLGVGLSNMARTDGNPNLSMYSMIIGAVLNTFLDPLYIFVFKWGVKGAAIATVTAQVISALILVYYFAKKGNMRFEKKYMKIEGFICKEVFILGISSCITQLASTVLQIIMNNSLVHYGNKSPVGGDVALSAMGIVMKVSMILISICIGVGIGVQPILGFNKGADKPKRIKKAYGIAAKVSTISSIIGWLACIFIPHIILAVFGTEDANFTEFAVKCMRIFMAGIFCAGFQITSTSYFQATGQAMKASILSLLRQVILLIPLILILPNFFGLDGILYAGPIADIVSGIIVFFFISHEMKKLTKQIKAETV